MSINHGDSMGRKKKVAGITIVLGILVVLLMSFVFVDRVISKVVIKGLGDRVISGIAVETRWDGVMYPGADGVAPMSTTSNSMSPTVRGGDIAVYETDFEFEELEVGDIVIFDAVQDGEDLLVLHRISNTGVDSEGTWFVTKGDNNMIDDSNEFGKLREGDILAEVKGVLYA